MDEQLQYVYLDEPEWGTIGGGISAYNKQQAGNDNGKSLCYVVRAPNQETLGGVIAFTYWNWLYIDLLWISEEHRRKGYGRHLMMLAEEEGRKRGATDAYLDTFSFQSPDFYYQCGYQPFGLLDDFPPGHKRYFLTKKL